MVRAIEVVKDARQLGVCLVVQRVPNRRSVQSHHQQVAAEARTLRLQNLAKFVRHFIFLLTYEKSLIFCSSDARAIN